MPFIEQMEEAYAWADFAICRAGALTVAELTCAGLGSILIPFPHAIDDHQTVNGKLLVEQGSALMIQQKELTQTMLAEEITQLCNSRSRLLDMAMRARNWLKPVPHRGLPRFVWRWVVSNSTDFQPPEMRRIRRIHFVGIGGSGMCGIAEVLLKSGLRNIRFRYQPRAQHQASYRCRCNRVYRPSRRKYSGCSCGG